MPGKRCVVHGCTNIADLNSLVLKESAAIFLLMILRSALKLRSAFA